MPRDIHRFTTWFKTIHRSLPSGTIDSIQDQANVVTDRWRQNAVSTVPTFSGLYVHPTNYWATSYLQSGSAFLYTYYFGAGSKHSWEGTDSPIGLVAPNLISYYTDTYGLPYVNSKQASLAASRVQRKLRDSNWDLGQDLAEVGETLNFLMSPIMLLINLVKAIHSAPNSVYNLVRTTIISSNGMKTNGLRRYMKVHRRALLKAPLKGAASLWLAYKFAWLPLMSSIYSAVEFAKNGFKNARPLVARSRVRGDIPHPNTGVGTRIINSRWHGFTEVEIACFYTPFSSFFNKLEQLGLTNPLSLAWELLPLSFVVDWFIPIGNFLQAMSSPMGVVFSEAYQTTYVKWDYFVRWCHLSAIEPTGKLCRNNARRVGFRRDRLAAFPLPVPYFRGFGIGTSGDKLISLMAIAAQRS